MRVTGQLIDGATGGHVWADRFDRDLTDIFAIQDEITQAIVDQLKIKLLPKEKKAIEQATTINVEAYTHYLKGREFFHNSTKAFLLLARRMFFKAVEADPLYARAYAGIANCDSRLRGWYNVAKSSEEILAMASKAIALDPDLAEAYAARGVALANSNRGAEAAEAFESALKLDPNSFDANLSYARFCVTEDKTDRAIELFLRALEIAPDDSQAPLLVQQVLRSLERIEESERYARLGLKRAEEALRLHPESSRPAQLGAAAFASLGEYDRAKEWLSHAMAIDPDDNNCRYNAACTYAQMGEIELAFDMLEVWAVHAGSEQEGWFKHDADLDPIREHPRYRVLLARIENIGPPVTA